MPKIKKNWTWLKLGFNKSVPHITRNYGKVNDKFSELLLHIWSWSIDRMIMRFNAFKGHFGDVLRLISIGGSSQRLANWKSILNDLFLRYLPKLGPEYNL